MSNKTRENYLNKITIDLQECLINEIELQNTLEKLKSVDLTKTDTFRIGIDFANQLSVIFDAVREIKEETQHEILMRLTAITFAIESIFENKEKQNDLQMERHN